MIPRPEVDVDHPTVLDEAPPELWPKYVKAQLVLVKSCEPAVIGAELAFDVKPTIAKSLLLFAVTASETTLLPADAKLSMGVV